MTEVRPSNPKVVPAQALQTLINAYVNALENARDRIVMLGGDCDSLEKMEAGDPYLNIAKAAVLNARELPDETSARLEYVTHRLVCAEQALLRFGMKALGSDYMQRFPDPYVPGGEMRPETTSTTQPAGEG